MTSHSTPGNAAIVNTYDFNQFESIADVGGGQGHSAGGDFEALRAASRGLRVF